MKSTLKPAASPWGEARWAPWWWNQPDNSRMTEPISSIFLHLDDRTFMCNLSGDLWDWGQPELCPRIDRCTQSSSVIFVELHSDNWEKERALLNDIFHCPPQDFTNFLFYCCHSWTVVACSECLFQWAFSCYTFSPHLSSAIVSSLLS